MAYEIVPYAPEFDPQIVQLQTYLWSPDPARNAAYLRWKYADNPFLKETLIQLALFDGRVVAMHGLFGSMWQVDDETTRHLLPHSDDFVVAPEHRNRGLASQTRKANLDNATHRGFPFVVSLSANPITFIIALAGGWRAAGSYASVWRNAARSARLERLQERVRRIRGYGRLMAALRALRPARPFERLDAAAGLISGRLSLSRAPRPEEMAALIAGLPWDGRIRHVRDAAYFAWRFRNPLHDYRFLFWDKHPSVRPEEPPSSGGVSKPVLSPVEGGGLRGYLVLQRYLSDPADQGGVNIADWEASDDGVQMALLETALQYGRFARIHSWTASLCEPAKTLLRDHGFKPSQPGGVLGQSNGLLVRRLGATSPHERWALGNRDLANIADWDLRMFYSMAG